MKRRLVTILCMILASLFFGNHSVYAQLPDTVKIAIVFPYTGPQALSGLQAKQGAELAANLVNKAGGIRGKTKIELVFGDDRCSPTDAVNVTHRLINQGIDFYVGNYCSSAALATMPILASSEIPQIIIGFAPSITEEARTPNSVRLCANSRFEAFPLAKYAVKVNKDKTIAFLGWNSDYGRTVGEELSKIVEKLGAKVVDFQYFPFGADFSTYLTRVKNLNVDGLVIVAMGNDMIGINKAYHELGLKINTYGNVNYIDTPFLADPTPKPENLFSTWLYDEDFPRAKEVKPPGPSVIEFKREFKAMYGKTPERNHGWGYSSVRVFEQAIAAVGTIDKKKIAEYLHSGAKFKTAFGEFGFEWCGQSNNKLGIARFKKNKVFLLKDKDWADDVLPPPCPPK